MIRVFKSPIGTRKLPELLSQLTLKGRRVLSIKRHEVDDFWLVKTANRQWFEALSREHKLRVVLGRRLND
jgi:hypothetical protein